MKFEFDQLLINQFIGLMEAQRNANSRRKRKDPQSRDFTCKCGKSYLSYAAAYTHVKNKHKLQKQFLDAIVKPQRQRLKRGRPKEKKQLDSNAETESLSIIEESILKIYQQLSASEQFYKMILQGNEEINLEQCQKELESIVSKHAELSPLHLQQPFQENEEYQEFANSLNKHFSEKTAARIKLVIRFVATHKEEKDSQLVIQKLNSLDLWDGHSNVNTIINDALHRWIEINRKDN